MIKNINILTVIKNINFLFDTNYSNKGFLTESYHNAVSFFTTQGCWYYAYILKKIFPDGNIFLGDFLVGHVIFNLNNKYYDVEGEYYFYNKDHFYCDKEVIGALEYSHPFHKDVINLCDLIINDINIKIYPTDLEKNSNLIKI
ncbi:MAG: hypothetical protein PHS24_04045 [Bacilli bacterium]|nr:hypothetical protein [Bacilli bacterium]